VKSGKVFQGGGTEVYDTELAPKLQKAAEQSLVRLFPQFGDADHNQWEVVIRRARDGSEDALKAVGWNGPTQDHPVCREVLKQLGAGALGAKVRAALKVPPFGWPQDAIDAALIALHRAGVVKVTKNGTALSPGQLDQASVGAAEFRTETVVVSVAEKLAARSVIAALGVPVKAGEEDAKAAEFLDRLRELLVRATGASPAPLAPETALIDELAATTGGARVVALAQKKAQLEDLIDRARKQADQIEKRLPRWRQLERLASHASQLAGTDATIAEIEAIRSNRSLLATPDPVEPLLAKLSNDLRAELSRRHQAFVEAMAAAAATLAGDASWQKLDAADRSRLEQQFGLRQPASLDIKTDDQLLAALDSRSLQSRADAAAAVPNRVAEALAEAARILQPKAQRVTLKAVTLATEAEVKAWVSEQEERLLTLVKQGPVTIG
jgi:hypothetical protein